MRTKLTDEEIKYLLDATENVDVDTAPPIFKTIIDYLARNDEVEESNIDVPTPEEFYQVVEPRITELVEKIHRVVQDALRFRYTPGGLEISVYIAVDDHKNIYFPVAKKRIEEAYTAAGWRIRWTNGNSLYIKEA